MKKNSAKIFSSGERKLVSLAKFAAFAFTKPGLALIRKIVRKKLAGADNNQTAYSDYHTWLHSIEKPMQPQRSGWPKISILINAVGAAEESLTRALRSVIDQSYPHWELICASTGAGTTLTYLASRDERIRLVPPIAPKDAPSTQNKATGDYFLWMRADDALAPWCLASIAAHANTYPQHEVVYADEDLIDEHGALSDPFFKPGWSPDTLLSRNYLGHNLVVKNGPVAASANGAESFYDLALRVTERAQVVAHIPIVLFHSTVPPFSETSHGLAHKALSQALLRRGLQGTVSEVPAAAGCYQVNYAIRRNEKVSIIIPTKDNTDLLQKTIDSILLKTDYPDYEIIVLDNNSSSSAYFKLMDQYADRYPGKFRCVAATFPFNFAQLMNIGAQLSMGSYLLMCNNDVEVLHDNWMTQMVAQAQQAHTGAVGVKLLFPNDTIQHAGIILGGANAAEHISAHGRKDGDGYFLSLKAATNYAAVTAACLMCRRSVFESVGGMDEQLAVEYNDVDLCLKFLKAGYYNVLLPAVTLYHHESATRGHPFRSKASWLQHEKELKLFTDRWTGFIENDPFFPPFRHLRFRSRPM